MKNKYFWQFFLISAALLMLFFYLHNSYLRSAEYEFKHNHLLLNYVINFLMALVIFVVLLVVNNRNTSIVGYVFLFGSLFKFLIYFLVLQPLLKVDGQVEKTKFFFFFLPYAICLIVEVILLIKMLNSQQEVDKA